MSDEIISKVNGYYSLPRIRIVSTEKAFMFLLWEEKQAHPTVSVSPHFPPSSSFSVQFHMLSVDLRASPRKLFPSPVSVLHPTEGRTVRLHSSPCVRGQCTQSLASRSWTLAMIHPSPYIFSSSSSVSKILGLFRLPHLQATIHHIGQKTMPSFLLAFVRDPSSSSCYHFSRTHRQPATIGPPVQQQPFILHF